MPTSGRRVIGFPSRAACGQRRRAIRRGRSCCAASTIRRPASLLYRKDYAIENSLWGGGARTYFQIVRVAPDAKPATVARAIDALFAGTLHATRTVPQQQVHRDYAKLMDQAGFILVSVSGAGMFALGVLFAMAAVQECGVRRGEFAGMMAIGFAPGGLSLLLLIENGLLSLGAAGIGIGLALIFESDYLMLLGKLFGPFAIGAGSIGATLAIAGFVALAATATPCAMIHRIRVASALNPGAGR